MYRRLMNYLDMNNILNSHQYRFRKKHSTFMAILELTNTIFESFENNEYTTGIFIDLKKAFDTVDHSILLSKLNFCGVRGTPLNWMRSHRRTGTFGLGGAVIFLPEKITQCSNV